MKLCIDLCSGLGGFSAAFRDSPDWEVVTVDIEKKFNPTICADVRTLGGGDIAKVTRFGSFKSYDKFIILASPPCTYFSRAAGVGNFRHGMAESLTIVAGVVKIIEETLPLGVIYVVENPDGGYLRFFLGKPNLRVKLNAYGYITVKPTAFWTNLGLLPLDIPSPSRNKTKNAFANGPKNPAVRALMPYKLSQAVLESVTNSTPTSKQQEPIVR